MGKGEAEGDIPDTGTPVRRGLAAWRRPVTMMHPKIALVIAEERLPRTRNYRLASSSLGVLQGGNRRWTDRGASSSWAGCGRRAAIALSPGFAPERPVPCSATWPT